MATTAATTGVTGASGLGGTAGAGMGAGSYGRVILSIKSAHNMRDKAWLGKSDPYCVVRLADAEIQTHHVKNAGEQCTWDETFAFNNVSPDDVTEFHVYDHNRILKDAHMGEGSLSLRQLFTEGRLDTRVPLTTRTGTKDAGEIWITLRTEGGELGVAGTGAGMAATTTTTTGMGATGMGVAGAAGTGAGYQAAEYERREGYERREDEYERTAGVGSTGMYATAVPAIVTEGAAAVPVAASQGEGAVCSQEYFTKVVDRPVVKERVTRVREHHPVEKEFVVETRATGREQATGERAQEHMGAEERVVEVAPPRAPCE